MVGLLRGQGLGADVNEALDWYKCGYELEDLEDLQDKVRLSFYVDMLVVLNRQV